MRFRFGNRVEGPVGERFLESSISKIRDVLKDLLDNSSRTDPVVIVTIELEECDTNIVP